MNSPLVSFLDLFWQKQYSSLFKRWQLFTNATAFSVMCEAVVVKWRVILCQNPNSLQFNFKYYVEGEEIEDANRTNEKEKERRVDWNLKRRSDSFF